MPWFVQAERERAVGIKPSCKEVHVGVDRRRTTPARTQPSTVKYQASEQGGRGLGHVVLDNCYIERPVCFSPTSTSTRHVVSVYRCIGFRSSVLLLGPQVFAGLSRASTTAQRGGCTMFACAVTTPRDKRSIRLVPDFVLSRLHSRSFRRTSCSSHLESNAGGARAASMERRRKPAGGGKGARGLTSNQQQPATP